MAKGLKRLYLGLKLYYSVSLAKSFKRFRDGLIYFTVGFIIIYFAQNSLHPSLKQEIVTMLGLVMVGIGFLIAMLAQVRMVIGRILKFFDKKY